MPIQLPKSFRASGVYCGVKSDPAKLDLSLVVSDLPAVAVGVFTKNVVVSAPVVINRERTPTDRARAVVINSGVANACTGEQGLADARRMAECTASALGAEEDQVMVMSTGVIGEMLPMEKIESGITDAAAGLAGNERSLQDAAYGMLTTDTCVKLKGRAVEVGGRAVQITGMAKGAAMIGPNMATMLSVIMTDATLALSDAQDWLSGAVDRSFNSISVEGHMSTSDTVLLLANGATGGEPVAGADSDAVRAAIGQVCEELAIAIVDDGEGATHRITIDVLGTRNRQDARTIAKTIAESALVKTAMTGADPNWGRIVSAAGYAGVPFDPRRVRLEVNDILLYDRGAPVSFDATAASASIAAERNVFVQISFGEGDASARFWTTDLTAEYVRLNADYHT